MKKILNIKKNIVPFTLLELLIVIAIIVILSSMLLPSITKGRNLSKAIVCKSNLKQIGIGCINYAGDYNEWMPPSMINGACVYYEWFNNDHQTSKGSFYHMLMQGGYISRPNGVITSAIEASGTIYPIIANIAPNVKSVMVCPAAPEMNHKQLFAYAMNSYIGGLGGILPENAGRLWRSLKVITKPSIAYLMIDKRETGCYSSETSGTTSGRFPDYRHSRKTNILFVDGHLSDGDIKTTYDYKYYKVF